MIELTLFGRHARLSPEQANHCLGFANVPVPITGVDLYRESSYHDGWRLLYMYRSGPVEFEDVRERVLGGGLSL